MQNLGAALVLKTPPAAEPITAAEVKAHARITASAEDALIGSYIGRARRRFETLTGRQLLRATWQMYVDRFPGGTDPIVVPIVPLVAVVSIKSYDADDVETTMSATDYRVDTASEPGRIILKNGKAWPTSLRREQAGLVEFTAGLAQAADVSDEMKYAIAQIVACYILRLEPDEEARWERAETAPFALVRLA